MKCGHPLSISVIAFITKMSNRGASHFISCSGNHWRNPRTGKKKKTKKPSDRPQLTQVKSSFSRCLSASFCGIKSWEAFWPTGAQAGVGEVVWSTGVQAEVGEGGLAHRDVGWGGGSGLAHRDTGWNGGSGLTHKGAGWGAGGVSFTDVFWHLGVWSFIIYNFWLPLFEPFGYHRGYHRGGPRFVRFCSESWPEVTVEFFNTVPCYCRNAFFY